MKASRFSDAQKAFIEVAPFLLLNARSCRPSSRRGGCLLNTLLLRKRAKNATFHGLAIHNRSIVHHQLSLFNY